MSRHHHKGKGALEPAVKHPPHSMEAEQSLIGGLLLNNRAWHDLADRLSEEDFYTRDHRLIYRAIGELLRLGRPADFVTVSEHLRQRELLDDAGGVAYLGTLCADTPSASNARAYAAIVRERALQRGLVAAGQDIAEMGYAPGEREPDTLLDEAQARIGRIVRTRQARAHSFAEIIDLADRAISEATRRREAGIDGGVPTGIPCLDTWSGGWQPNNLVIIAGRPGLGKTAFLNQIALHAARRGHAGLILSLEMGPETLGIRAMASAAAVNVSALIRGYRETHEAAALKAVELAGLPLHVDTDTYSLSGICTQIGEYRRSHGIQWAAIDHIGLIETRGFNTRNEQIGAITRSLKKMAKRLQIPIIALSQLSRGVEKDRRRPTLADLRDSGNIEQDADACLFLHSEAEDQQATVPVELGLLKNRGGRKGWLSKRVLFNGATQTFHEVAEHEPLNSGGPDRFIPRQRAAPHWQDGREPT